MSDIVADLIGRFGLVAVFVGCVLEGETAALAAGFLAHQHLVPLAGTLPAVYAGALAGDTAMFMAGRRWADHRFVTKLRSRRGFSHAMHVARTHPNLFVFFNRYVYGMRTIGAVTSGLSGISLQRYLAISAVSCALWTCLFVSLGYFVGLGVESFIGGQLHRHQRLVTALVFTVATALVFVLVSRKVRGRLSRGSAE